MFVVNFSTPTPGSAVNNTFTVTGTVGDDGVPSGSFPNESRALQEISARFGPTGPDIRAQGFGTGTWSVTGSLPAGTQGGQTVAVTVTASGVAEDLDSHDDVEISADSTLQVVAEQTPPQVVINAFANDKTVDQPPYLVPSVTGQALDSSGVTQVQYTIDNGPRHAVDSVTGAATQVTWSVANLSFDTGQHTLAVIATDSFGNEGVAQTTVTVRVSTPPPPPPPPSITPVELSYAPTFKHKNWINNVSRVTAGGPDGFNVRLDAIDADLRQAATVVDQINTALNLAAAGLLFGQQTLTPGLDFVPLSSPGWVYDNIGSAHPPVGSGGDAVMDLTIPDGARLVSFRAIGLINATLSVTLWRASLTDPSQSPDMLAQVSNLTQGITNPYDVTAPVDPAFASVDTDAFRYYVLASATSISDATGNSVATVQLVFTG
jgi:hypothetical protein